MRLIDADTLILALNERYNEKSAIVPNNLAEGFVQVEKLIKEQQTAYDVEKVVKQLKEKTDLAYNRYMDCVSYNPASERYKTQYQERKMCLDIVKSGLKH